MDRYEIELTDTFGGDANYAWVRREIVTMPELAHYGYDGGTNYSKANKVYERELMRKAKAAMGLTNVRGRVERYGDNTAFYPYKRNVVMFISFYQE